jgi:hypothetical protein
MPAPCWGSTQQEADLFCSDFDPETVDWCSYGGAGFVPWEDEEPPDLNGEYPEGVGYCVNGYAGPCSTDDECDDGLPWTDEWCSDETGMCVYDDPSRE